MVLEAFRRNRVEGEETRHLNNDKTDNRLSNLRWATHLVNVDDQRRFGTMTVGEKNAMAKLTKSQATEIRRRRVAGESGRMLANEFSVSEATVCRIYKGYRYASA